MTKNAVGDWDGTHVKGYLHRSTLKARYSFDQRCQNDILIESAMTLICETFGKLDGMSTKMVTLELPLSTS